MKLLVIRHAPAGNRHDATKSGEDDAQRSLTRRGRRRMRRSAKALARLVPHINVLASSPLSRAVQTAEIVEAEYEGLTSVQIPALSPRKTPATLLHWLQQQSSTATVAIVGHEPSLGVFVSWMLTGLQESFVPLKKGGACLLELDGEIRAGRAKLTWLLKSSHLRDLA